MRPVMLSIAVLLLLAAGASAQKAVLTRYDTPYYIMHTDLEIDDAREAAVRMTRMYEEYQQRTAQFAGNLPNGPRALPFYLYKNSKDYYASGGVSGSAGVFTGRALMAVADDKGGPARTWHIIQHEGFHQFADATIGRRLPVWASEGLAEYFGHALFTGDSFVAGVIPSDRLRRIKQKLERNQFKPLDQMMLLKLQQWNMELSTSNYDQGWAMVQFLAHADDGKYTRAFTGFLQSIDQGSQWKDAWVLNFGPDVAAFEKRWKEYWLGLDDDPTADLFVSATTSTLASFLARAASQKQTFDTFDEFLAAAEKGQIRSNPTDWLPPALLKDAVKHARTRGEWSLEPGAANSKRIVCRFQERAFIGSFTLNGNRIGKVTLERPKAAAGKGP